MFVSDCNNNQNQDTFSVTKTPKNKKIPRNEKYRKKSLHTNANNIFVYNITWIGR